MSRAPRVDLTLKRQAGRQEEVRVLTLEVAGWLSSTLGGEDAGFPDFGEELFRASALQQGTLPLALLRKTVPSLSELRTPHPEAKTSSFQARDNLSLFLERAREVVAASKAKSDATAVAAEDIVAHRNLRGCVYFLLSLARELYLQHGVEPPMVVLQELEIDALPRGDTSGMAQAQLGRGLEHEPYVAAEGDYLDAWIAAFVNQNQIPLVAVPARLPVPETGGQYIFPYEEGDPKRIYHVRMVRGTPLYRDGGEWKELAELMRSKMAAAYAAAGMEMRALNAPEGVKPPRPLGEPIVQEAQEHLEALRAIEKDRVIYVAGQDAQGRAVVVVVGSRIPPLTDQRMYHVLLFLALTLDKHGRKPYVLIYAHTHARFARKYFAWIKKARAKLPYVWKKNLSDLVILHPSLFIKACFGFMRPFISPKFWRKLHYFNSRSTDGVNELIAPLEAASALPAFVNLHGKHQFEAGKLFGGTLATAALRDLGQGEQYAERVPRVVYETVEFLRSTALGEEGLFRVSGPKKDEEAVRALYERDEDVQWLRGELSPHTAAGVLKTYLRELGEPLVPEDAFADAIALGEEPTADAAARIVAALPDANRHALAYLASFLAQVAARSDENKMTAANLALVVAPNLVRRADEDADAMLENSKKKAAAVQFLIENADQLFDSGDAAGFDPSSPRGGGGGAGDGGATEV